MITPQTTPPTNAMSVDVEDYFQVSALAPLIDRASWDTRPCRIERNVARLLELFDRRGAKATFFTLGWIAQRYPQVVRAIVERGHEVASHGYAHQRVTDMSRSEFEQDVRRAKALLEDLAGQPVRGYRAPSFSIDRSNDWAFDVLLATGHAYSSSVYPVQHDHYGVPDAPRFPYQTRPGLLEIPLTTTRLLGRNLPASGGGYFRLAPYPISRWALRRFNQTEQRSAVFYMHPWEIDPGQPRIPRTTLKTRVRHYLNLHKTESRLDNLLSDFRWGRMDQVFGVTTVQ
jgi:polysaccharide deacetylase family protein (PEP-CTERM system associated)